MIHNVLILLPMMVYAAIAIMLIKKAVKVNNATSGHITCDTKVLKAYSDKFIHNMMNKGEIDAAIELLQSHGYVVYTHEQDVRNRSVLAGSGIL